MKVGVNYGVASANVARELTRFEAKLRTLVADMTARLIAEQRLTALMVTHNMQQALSLGTRTLMMHQGRIILDISGADVP